MQIEHLKYIMEHTLVIFLQAFAKIFELDVYVEAHEPQVSVLTGKLFHQCATPIDEVFRSIFPLIRRSIEN